MVSHLKKDFLFIEDLPIAPNDLVVIRADLNVPLQKGKIQNNQRIQASLPTIRYLQKKQARIIVLSHLGRPRAKVVDDLRLAPVAQALQDFLEDGVLHYAKDCIGPIAETAVAKLNAGEVLLLENVRFYNAEKKNDSDFARQLSHGATYYINDAFGTAHRTHASTSSITQHVKSAAAGYLIQKEINALTKIAHNPKRPYLALCGGAKIADKIQLITNLLDIVDQFLIGGAMAFTFLKAMGHNCGLSLVENNQLSQARKILDNYADKIKLPLDFMVTDNFDFGAGKIGNLRPCAFDNIPQRHYALDIGPATIEHFKNLFQNVKTIFWNGPMGLSEFEKTAKGSLSIAKLIAELSGQVITIIGGGDSAAMVAQANLTNRFNHVSTGGGAALSFLEGKTLPSIVALSK